MALCFLFLDFFFVGKEVGWSTSLKGELWVKWLSLSFPICCFQSLSCVWLCDPMDCSMPGFPVPHHLLELAQAHVHWVGEAIPSSVAPFSSCLQSFPASGSFPFSGETNQMLNFLVKFVFCHNWQVLGNVFITLLLNKNLCIRLLSLCGILTQARLEQDAPECRTVGQSTSSGACSAVNSSHLVMNMPFCLAPSIRTPSLTSKFNPMWVWWEWAQPTKDIRGQIQGLPHSGRVLDVVTQDSESGARTHRCGHLIFFIFWSRGLACRILVPQPGSSGSMESSLDLQGSPEVITSSPSPGGDVRTRCGGSTCWCVEVTPGGVTSSLWFPVVGPLHELPSRRPMLGSRDTVRSFLQPHQQPPWKHKPGSRLPWLESLGLLWHLNWALKYCLLDSCLGWLQGLPRMETVNWGLLGC